LGAHPGDIPAEPDKPRQDPSFTRKKVFSIMMIIKTIASDNGDGKKPQKEESSALNRQPTKSIEILTRAREEYPKISRNLVREVPRSLQNRSGTLLEHTRAKKTPKNRKSLVQK